MGILEQITMMKNQGKSDQEIISKLREQGLSPKSIQDSMAQLDIKNAVSGSNVDGMQQSIMGSTEDSVSMYEDEDVPRPNSSPQAQPMYYPQEQMGQGAYSQEYYQQPQEYYQEEYAYSASDTSNLIEISEQVFSDKIKKIQNQIDQLTQFKTLSETKLNIMEERLKRIENTIDKLQMSILDEVGSYGNNLESIKKEMSMMQDSFSKVINPVLDKSERIHRRK